MIYKLDPADYEQAHPLFRTLQFHLSSAAVLDGNNPGRVCVDDPVQPQSAFMFSPEGCYLVGNPHTDRIQAARAGDHHGCGSSRVCPVARLFDGRLAML